LKETLYQKAEVAILSVAGAVLLTFLFSMALFRSLGNIGHMLDRAASGEYELEILPSDKTATDELSVMASKVNLLGQRLRGAQFEVSDLRGNIDTCCRTWKTPSLFSIANSGWSSLPGPSRNFSAG